MEKEEAEVGVQAAEVKVVQADAQADLDVALPTLEKALKALDSLTKNDITEVKSFAKPPPAVQTVMEAVCILLEVSSVSPFFAVALVSVAVAVGCRFIACHVICSLYRTAIRLASSTRCRRAAYVNDMKYVHHNMITA